MTLLKGTYRLLRSVLFTLILTFVGIYVLLYVGLSLPWVQNRIREVAQRELSALMQTDVTIGELSITPFNMVVLNDVRIPSPDGEPCIEVDKIGAGIDILELLSRRHVRVTFAEIMGLRAQVTQQRRDGPLNVQFLIDAFKPKQPGQPPKRFDIAVSTVVIRKSALSFDRLWAPEKPDPRAIDFNHLSVSNLRADVSLPRLSNDDFEIDLRRLALVEKSGFTVQGISARASITARRLRVDNLEIRLPESLLAFGPLELQYPSMDKMAQGLRDRSVHLQLKEGAHVSPTDLAPFFTPLDALDARVDLRLDAYASLREVECRELALSAGDLFRTALQASVSGLDSLALMSVNAPKIEVEANTARLVPFLQALGAKVAVTDAATGLGFVRIYGNGASSPQEASAELQLESVPGNLDLKAFARMKNGKPASLKADVASTRLQLGEILPKTLLGDASFNLSADLAIGPDLKLSATRFPDVHGSLSLDVPSLGYNGHTFTDISLSAERSGEPLQVQLDFPGTGGKVSLTAEAAPSHLSLDGFIEEFMPSMFGVRLLGDDADFGLAISADVSGSSLDNLSGYVNVSDLTVNRNNDYLRIETIDLRSDIGDDGRRDLTLRSDFADADLTGSYSFSRIRDAAFCLAHRLLPSWMPRDARADRGELAFDEGLEARLRLDIKPENSLVRFFKPPVGILDDIVVDASVDGSDQSMALTVNAPWLRQGKDKLIKESKVSVRADGRDDTAKVDISTLWPVKGGHARVNVAAGAMDDSLSCSMAWDLMRDKAYRGKISLSATAGMEDILPGAPPVKVYDLTVHPSRFYVNDAQWKVDDGSLKYYDKMLKVNNIGVSHDQQLALIHGVASTSPQDTITVNLRDIDLDYLFETLNINYVNFGGLATGDVYASQVFTSEPKASTDNLYVEGLKYNNAVLGDGHLKSAWHNDSKMVSIYADIRDKQDHRTALVDGGIWVTRDSLSIAIDADKVNARFMRPFFEAFSSDVDGIASGQVKIYGTFADVNLIGKVHADKIRMKVDYTNVYYEGSDSVMMTPGRIVIPNFRIYDQYGHSGVLNGVVTHNYFHEPKFDFTVRDCQDLLCFNTNASMNPVWYGTIYGTGGGTIRGVPGYVGITVDMTTAPKSEFTFVLSDTQDAQDYQFLTFTDSSRKEQRDSVFEALPPAVQRFHRQRDAKQGELVRESVFALDVRGTVTPAAQLTIVMDPVSGDKITARGGGPMQIGYNSANDSFTMNGKYEIEQGSYNFSLQDLILKDFIIKPGSSISFDGDPFNATLNIDAVYRVNTNLTDLDKSFANDKDLNRTNVPVDAVLQVSGPMTHPDISFDIELPTMTADVERKVKSIVSTDDMMNRQIIYLLALNRFYTPEYMGGSGSGGEWASMASSTISSQLSNMVSQLSSNWTFAPSFHSDKGDFSDFEFDMALSSSLLNNRLLFNGNFGYRDRTTSTTTFIGDFDLEYLLNPSGNLRLKAYNHFNDQNYYLKSAQTTQGIGVVYKLDFDSFKNLFRRRKKAPKAASEASPADSVAR